MFFFLTLVSVAAAEDSAVIIFLYAVCIYACVHSQIQALDNSEDSLACCSDRGEDTKPQLES